MLSQAQPYEDTRPGGAVGAGSLTPPSLLCTCWPTVDGRGLFLESVGMKMGLVRGVTGVGATLKVVILVISLYESEDGGKQLGRTIRARFHKVQNQFGSVY